jgi:Pyridine nucleotide-disulphide oxidoreductase
MCQNDSSSERVAIIGGGVSGIAAAVVLQEQGFRTVIYEQADRVGGIWRTAYPGAKLQNAHFQYKLKDFSWADAGIKPDWKPTAAHVQQYFEAAACHHQLNVRLHHTVRRTARNTTTGTWTVAGDSSTGPFEDTFSHLMVCTGLFDNLLPPSANAAAFRGLVLTRHQVTAEILHELRSQGKTLAVVGNGKSGNDLATLAADAGILVKHVFRAPRWAVPDRLLGLCATWAFFTRVNTVMIPSWDYPSSGERALHKYFSWAIRGFWSIISLVVWAQVKNKQNLQLCSLHRQPRCCAFACTHPPPKQHGSFSQFVTHACSYICITSQFSCPAWLRGSAARKRMAVLKPKDSLTFSFRNSIYFETVGYSSHIAQGSITPVCAGSVTGFTEDGLMLSTGHAVAADCVLLCTGSACEFVYYNLSRTLVCHGHVCVRAVCDLCRRQCGCMRAPSPLACCTCDAATLLQHFEYGRC